MDPQVEQALYDGMQHETERRGPPEDFSELPVIPAGRYTDPAFLALEQEHLWQGSWLYALHADELPKPGSFRLWDKTGSPIVIVRGQDDEIRAFYNACAHRGAPLVEERQGDRKGFFCRYHGWSYGLDGRLLAVREPRDFPGFDKTCHGLTSVRCERWGNWVFINENPDADPLLEHLQPIVDHCAGLQVDGLRHIASDSFPVACNVKVLLDAFLETYHLKSIHPQTVDRFLDSKGTFVELWPHGHSVMATPHRNPDWSDPGAEGMPEIETTARIHREQNISYNVYPNLVFPPSATGIPILTFWPNGPRDMIVDVHWFAPEAALGHELWPTRIGNFARILEEDTQFAPSIQKSVEAKGFRGMFVSYAERRIYAWHEELDRRIGVDNIPPELRVEPRLADHVRSA
jgi:phenylpropionate dioxygenase-like ring-hydroxylating dioxygenase large terminal subunit